MNADLEYARARLVTMNQSSGPHSVRPERGTALRQGIPLSVAGKWEERPERSSRAGPWRRQPPVSAMGAGLRLVLATERVSNTCSTRLRRANRVLDTGLERTRKPLPKGIPSQ